jgi:hypothetical protein
MVILTGPVEDFLYCPIPDEVWHYTNLAGFRGIIASGRIWATEARFTNDSTEFTHARDIALTYLGSSNPPDEHQAFAYDEAHKVVESVFSTGILSPSLTEVFITSFSAAVDLKSQWSDYADRYCGVSIAFDLHDVRPPRGQGIGVTFAPCVYETPQKQSLIESALSHFIEEAARMHRQVLDQGWILSRLRDKSIIQRAIGGPPIDKQRFNAEMHEELRERIYASGLRTAFDLLRVASHCKNAKFLEEDEWRLALPHTKGKAAGSFTIKFRGAKGEIPYIESNLFQTGPLLPVTRVMLGPLCEAQSEVEEILKMHGYDVPISGSEVPIRAPARP